MNPIFGNGRKLHNSICIFSIIFNAPQPQAYPASSSHGFREAAIGQGIPCYKEKIMSYSCMMFVDSKNIYGNPGLQHLNFTLKIKGCSKFLECNEDVVRIFHIHF